MDFNKAVFKSSCGLSEQLTFTGKREIVFCGRSNVGKSSLLNKLCARNSLARVSSSPGKTTTINFFTLSDEYDMVDLPGYGYARRSNEEKKRWGELIEHYFGSGRTIALVLQLLDSRHAPSSDDMTMLDYIRSYSLPCAAVLTKTDKLNKTEYRANMEMFEKILKPYNLLAVCPFTTNGTESAQALRSTITSIIEENTDADI